jgi:hypothetical protein
MTCSTRSADNDDDDSADDYRVGGVISVDDAGAPEPQVVLDAAAIAAAADRTVDADHIVSVHQNRRQRAGLFAFIAALIAAALVRGLIGASTTNVRVAVGVIFGVILAVVLTGWWRVYAGKAELEISALRIRYLDTSGREFPDINRSGGSALAWVVTRRGRLVSTSLRQTATNTSIALSLFDRREVIAACVAAGWQFPS